MGMKSGDWTEAAKQILADDPAGSEIFISDTVNDAHDGHIDAYRAVKRADDSVKLTKYNS